MPRNPRTRRLLGSWSIGTAGRRHGSRPVRRPISTYPGRWQRTRWPERQRAADWQRTVAAVSVAALMALAALAATPASAVPATTFGTDVLSWGLNDSFQLGNGTRTPRLAPGSALLPDGLIVTDVASGDGFSLALTSHGQVYAWGDNDKGQLGNNTITAADRPAQVHIPSGETIVDITAGNSHALAVTDRGTVYAWGDNRSGTLGNGSTADSRTPVPVSLPDGVRVTEVSSWHLHNLALTSAGTALAWGNNTYGQIGDGTTSNRLTPVQVAGVTGVTEVSAGFGHSLALVAGRPYAWGGNDFGQLGDGTTTSRPRPVAVSGFADETVLAVSAGSLHSLALLSGNRMRAWGANDAGQLGDDTLTTRTSPVEVHDLPTGSVIAEISAGGRHNLVRTAAGPVYAWGENDAGQLGDGTGDDRRTPVQVAVPAGFTVSTVEAGILHSLAVAATGPDLSWGANDFGQLGNPAASQPGPLGPQSNAPDEVTLPASTVFTSIAAGYHHSLGVTASGKVLAWGRNDIGQLGNNSTTDTDQPVQALLPSGTVATAVAAGLGHSLALTGDGRVFAWGRNKSGQLGIGTSSILPTMTPVPVPFPSAAGSTDPTVVTAISANNVQSMALTEDGRLFVWGNNELGQLGTGDTRNRNTPTLLPQIYPATDIAAGGLHSLAMTSNGVTYAWGDNKYGQLGNGTTVNALTPTIVRTAVGARIVNIDAGLLHSLAITDNGRALAWGNNFNGELGNRTKNNASIPTSVHLPAGVQVVSLTGGTMHSLAVSTLGRIYAWGDNRRGQLGTGNTRSSLYPVLVQQPPGTVAVAVAGGQWHSLAR